MSETSRDAALATPTAADLPLVSADPTPSSPLVRFGGLLGIVGSTVGIVALVAACAGFHQAMAAGWASLGLGAVGLLVVLVGAFTQRARIAEDTHVMQAVFATLISLIGGLLEVAVYLRWPIFPK
jgi:hypothetical protein